MTYIGEFSGIYAVVNKESNTVYIGQSLNVKKRIGEHLRLLRKGEHTNPHLQSSFSKYGEGVFAFDVLVICEDQNDLNDSEAPFLDGRASYDGMPIYNIAKAPTGVMSGRKHSPETKAMMSRNRKGKCGHITPEYREKLKLGHTIAKLNDPEFMNVVREVIRLKDEEGLNFSQIAKKLNLDPHAPKAKYNRYKEYL